MYGPCLCSCEKKNVIMDLVLVEESIDKLKNWPGAECDNSIR
jgi:hypothetical protein